MIVATAVSFLVGVFVGMSAMALTFITAPLEDKRPPKGPRL